MGRLIRAIDLSIRVHLRLKLRWQLGPQRAQFRLLGEVVKNHRGRRSRLSTRSRAVGHFPFAENAAVAEGSGVEIFFVASSPEPGFTHCAQRTGCALTIAAAHPAG